MEVNKTPRQASQFWPSFYKKTIIIVAVTQLGVTLLVAGLMAATGVGALALLIIVGALFATSLIANIIIVHMISRPTKDLIAAIIHVSGEKPALPLPNSNSPAYAKSGLHDALQTIYELSTHQDDSTDTASDESTTPSSAVAAALDLTNCGFVAMDSNRAITYVNKAAPIHIDTNGVRTLDLLFNDHNDLNKWLDSCEEVSVHAEHVWTRVPDRLPNEENRRLFDVMASYNKGSAAETVLTLIDRTDVYSVDEESLDFIAFAAHELRGPITVIRGYLDVLNDELDSVLQDDQHELFRRLIVSSNRLSGYINNILNTSRYDRRHLKVHLIEDSIGGIYDVISDDMKMRATAQNRLLAVQIPAGLPTIAADRASLSEVLGNLIDNAIKYSNEGGAINVTAAVNGNFVDVSVEDHGIGMPESVVSQLFQKFYRSHRSRETVAGTGIGLYISKAIVESHGGTISVRSEDGRGSTFTVSIPIYSTVADKLRAGNNSNEGMIKEGQGWIKNHSMYRG